MTKDYYDILGVDKNATKEEIQRTYKKLAKKYHPDLNKSPDATEKFKEINEAASVLTDDKKRAQYDQFGQAGAQGFGAGAEGFDFSNFSGFGGFEDLFDNVFSAFGGGFGGRRGSRRGRDLQYPVTITLEEAAQGLQKTIVLPRMGRCASCEGTGAKDGKRRTCNKCNGKGQVQHDRQTPFGVFRTSALCVSCRGVGEVPEHVCATCSGAGRKKVQDKLTITIPAGVQNDMQLKLEQEGEAGEQGAPTGDLFVLISVRPHDIFERSGDDLYSEVEVPFATTVLGGQLQVQTLQETVTMKIPAGTQDRTRFRLAGHGMPRLQSRGKGNLHLTISIQVPKKLSKKQKLLLQQFADETPGNDGVLSGLRKKLRGKRK